MHNLKSYTIRVPTFQLCYLIIKVNSDRELKLDENKISQKSENLCDLRDQDECSLLDYE